MASPEKKTTMLLSVTIPEYGMGEFANIFSNLYQ